MEMVTLAKVLKKRLWLILLCVIVSALSTFYFVKKNDQPVYEASTKLIINSTVSQDQLGLNQEMDLGAVTVNIGLIETYKEIIMSPAILDKVVQQYPELGLTVEQLSSGIQVSALNDTQIITIGTTDHSYEQAAGIVNAVANVVKSEIPRIMKVNNVEILTVADPYKRPQPINSNMVQTLAISIVASLIFAVGVSLLLEFMNDTLKSKQDIQKTMGLPTLTSIPVMKHKKTKKKQAAESRTMAGDSKYAVLK